LKIPKKVKIAGHSYKVLFPYVFTEVNNTGQADLLQKQIKLSEIDKNGAKLPKSEIENTFCHEILHCINWEYCRDGLKEEQIEPLANGLYQVLKDNHLNFGG